MSVLLARLASPKLTLAILAAIAASVLMTEARWSGATEGLAVALSLVVVNLAAATIINPAFRRQSALLVFHLSLIAIILLVASSRLCYLKGHLELAAGESFAGLLTDFEAGQWHRGQLDAAAFTNDGFAVNYDPGLLRGKTVNRVHWNDENGRAHRAVIGDNHPLVLHGYRFYTSFNKGFAPAFLWLPKSGGQTVRGTVHLPSYPMHEAQQSIEWAPPNSTTRIWTTLHIDQPLLDPQKVSHFALPSNYRLVVRAGEARYDLRPGDRVSLSDGILIFEGLSTWMGYMVFYDWTSPWLLASCLVAALSLAWHYWRKFIAPSKLKGE